MKTINRFSGTRTLGMALGLAAAVHAAQPARPNIVLILADDMGYDSVQANNPKSGIRTPHLDRLAREGMNFTDAHTDTSVCTPTRYGLLTGRYSWRSSLKSGVLWPWLPPLIDPKQITVAEMLKGAGYETAMVGKWHLGLDFTSKDGRTIAEETGYAIRRGDWKPIFRLDRKARTFSRELYNLKDDIKETADVLGRHPEVVADLTQLFATQVQNGRSTVGPKQVNFEDPQWMLPFPR